MNPIDKFNADVRSNIARAGEDRDLHALSLEWSKQSGEYGYTYNFAWLGVPIIQLPQDTVAMQEIVWRVKPDLIIETGIAYGGSIVMSASMLALLDYCEGAQARRKVIGIDIDIRAHNRAAIERHPLAKHIEMIQGSSVDAAIVDAVRARAKAARTVLVCLDSNHTHEHVLAELEAYAPLVTPGSYCVVFDTLIEDRPKGFFPNRPWDKGNNPKTAVWEYLKKHPEFEIDREIENKTLITTAPDGYLKRVR